MSLISLNRADNFLLKPLALLVRLRLHTCSILEVAKIRKTWEQDGENKAITHPGRAQPWWHKDAKYAVLMQELDKL